MEIENERVEKIEHIKSTFRLTHGCDQRKKKREKLLIKTQFKVKLLKERYK